MSGQRLTTDNAIRDLLERARTIAVVGLSPRPHRPSHGVAAYLQASGYRIVPVHPEGGTILGEPVFGSLHDAVSKVGAVDIVDVFRRSDALPDLVPQVIVVRPQALWLQLGVRDPGAESEALTAGLDLVADRCMLVEHQRLVSR